MSWIYVTEISTPPGVKTWAESVEPEAVDRLNQFHYDNGVQEMTFEGPITSMRMTSTFYDQAAHANFKSAAATDPDYQARDAYNQANGITQRNIYEGLAEGYDQSNYL
jgi:hypothetical protein